MLGCILALAVNILKLKRSKFEIFGTLFDIGLFRYAPPCQTLKG